MVHLILCSAGMGKRLKLNQPKALVLIQGRPIFIWALRNLLDKGIDFITIIYPVGYKEQFQKALQTFLTKAEQKKIYGLISGGKERMDSVLKAVRFLQKKRIAKNDVILVHNASNLFVEKEELNKVIALIKQKRCACGLAFQAVDTIREQIKYNQYRKKDRSKIFQMQTPQGALFEDLKKAYLQAKIKGNLATDDLELLEKVGLKSELVLTNRFNFKITYKEDLILAKLIIKEFNN